MRDIFLEARAQLAYARMAAAWLDDQVSEHLGQFAAGAIASGASTADATLLESQAEFFRSALQPALSVAIVLSSFSLLEQALQRICERHAAYDRKGGRCWSQLAGSGILRASAYFQAMCGPSLARSGLIAELDDLRIVRNHLAHRGTDFRAAPKGASRAAQKHGLVDGGGSADPHLVLGWMFDLQGRMLDALEVEMADQLDRGD